MFCATRLPTDEDHVPPKSWYPVNLPRVQPPKVPCCGECNDEFAVLEEDFLLFIGTSFENIGPEFGGGTSGCADLGR